MRPGSVVVVGGEHRHSQDGDTSLAELSNSGSDIIDEEPGHWSRGEVAEVGRLRAHYFDLAPAREYVHSFVLSRMIKTKS